MEAGATKKEPKIEAKGGDEDLSMEEILQSIRRIIADDDNEGKKSVSPEKNKGKAADDDVPGSDMLELTDMLKDDGTVVDLKKEAATAAKIAAIETTTSFDILSQIDSALDAVEKPAEAPKPAPVAATPAPATPAPVMAAPVAAPAPLSADSLLSDAAAAATAEAFNRLKSVEPPPVYAVPTGGPAFRSGATMEDLVSDMLRPMLKQWLDANLPAMVQQIVEREVKKLTR